MVDEGLAQQLPDALAASQVRGRLGEGAGQRAAGRFVGVAPWGFQGVGTAPGREARPAQSSNVENLPSTSEISAAGAAPMRSARRARQSTLRT